MVVPGGPCVLVEQKLSLIMVCTLYGLHCYLMGRVNQSRTRMGTWPSPEQWTTTKRNTFKN
ncbi:hypothetical protein TSUD_245630 [Trifolium subterraneum]|uniref:Uncharacterized protein n=1 Tax=Trifolium subterraneum TaxID=3900 RepID=A0A2Z6PG84_TRISU|nr:hypothetical protein TSUD_245630 [Trifolium subterraneum]